MRSLTWTICVITPATVVELCSGFGSITDMLAVFPEDLDEQSSAELRRSEGEREKEREREREIDRERIFDGGGRGGREASCRGGKCSTV